MDPLRLLADQRCVACDDPGTLLCPACRSGLPWLRGPLCPRCGEPGPPDRLRCPVCERLGRAVRSARTAIALDGTGAAIVRAWKDGARHPVAGLAAALVAAAVPPPAVDVIVAVPPARDRAAWRGVDGPQALAGVLATRWRLPLLRGALERVDDRPQRGLSRSARQRRARGLYRAVAPVAGRVLLVDDVLTTGATAAACTRRLRRAGARSVDVVTLARVVTAS